MTAPALSIGEGAFLLRVLAGRKLPREAVLDFQTRRLRRLVAHAHRNVPYYTDLLDCAGVRPRDIRTPEDLAAVPVSTRRSLQRCSERELLARGLDPAKLLARRTSGTSGEPFIIRRAPSESRWLRRVRRSALRELFRPGERVAFVHGVGRPSRGGVVTSAKRSPLILELDPKRPAEELARELVRHDPAVVSGLPGVLAEVASVVRSDPRLAIAPRLVVSGGELLHDARRRLLQEVFGCPVAETYAAWEVGLIGWTCATTGAMHVCGAGVLVQVMADGRPAAPGETGTLVATALHSFAMPFLNYAIGDVVTAGGDPCRCGAPFATLLSVDGREWEYFTLPDGRRLHPFHLVNCIRSAADVPIQRYEFVQERPDRVLFRFVPLAPPEDEALGRLRTKLQDVLGPGVGLGIETVERLDAGPGGKVQPFRALPSPFAERLFSSRAP